MFTGLIEEVGIVSHASRRSDRGSLVVRANRVIEDAKIGDSIAVNGACLTIVRFDTFSFEADVTPETFRRSNLQCVKPGERVNLERAVRLHSRFGGHLVQGHVDGTGVLRSKIQEGNAVYLTVDVSDPALLRYLLPKGSIAVDGVSLTVVETGASTFRVSVIPHTLNATTLGGKPPGTYLNLETDLIGKYVERLMVREEVYNVGSMKHHRPQTSSLTEDMLKKHGYG